MLVLRRRVESIFVWRLTHDKTQIHLRLSTHNILDFGKNTMVDVLMGKFIGPSISWESDNETTREWISQIINYYYRIEIFLKIIHIILNSTDPFYNYKLILNYVKNKKLNKWLKKIYVILHKIHNLHYIIYNFLNLI